MDLDLIVNSLAALGAAVIGAGAVLLAQRSQARREAIAADAQAMKRSVEEVLVRSLSVSMRCAELTTVGAHIGSVGGHAGRLLHIESPVNFTALFSALQFEVDALNRAATQAWMNEDPATVHLVTDVMVAAGDLVDVHTGGLSRGLNWRVVRRLLTGHLPDQAARVKPTQIRLSEARSSLVAHARNKWGLEPLDGAVDR